MDMLLSDDYAIKALKSQVQISNSIVQDNDQLLIANTQSILDIINTTFANITCNNVLFSAISSAVTIRNVSLKNVSYLSTSNVFSKIEILSQSSFDADNFTIDGVVGPLIYATESTINVSNSLIQNSLNYDNLNPLISLDSSTIGFANTSMKNLKSLLFSPIFSLSSNTFELSNSSITDFDKTLFGIDEGVYSFKGLKVQNGSNTATKASNSIVFDTKNANLSLSNSEFTGISTLHSCPIVYIERDDF